MRNPAPPGFFSLACRRGLVGLMLLAGSAPGFAQSAADSRIVQVKVYAGSATVERVARISAGSQSVTFACLPANLQVQSLQVSADAGVQIGETAVLTTQRAFTPRCQSSALDARILALEDQKATLQAESEAMDLVTGYLKGLGAPEGTRTAPDARNIAALAEALRRTGQDALQKKHQLGRQQEQLDRQLGPLLAERGRLQRGDEVLNVTVTLASAADADVRLSYRVNGPGWSPSYRALLDSASGKLRLERQALVAQATGEDWRGVRLLLSTGQPQAASSGRLPTPWNLGLAPPLRPEAEARLGRQAAMATAAPAPASATASRREDAPLFNVNMFHNTFSTEFSVARPMDVPSSGQRVAMTLGQHEDRAKLVVRTSPKVEAAAYLVAELAYPEGVWWSGPLQLYRDGAFVGNSQWTSPEGERLLLSFGRDDLVRVQAEPVRDNRGTGGFAGSRAERRVQHAYVIENRHRTPVSLQVVEAVPVAVDEQVKVSSQFEPQPTELVFDKHEGLILWALELPAGKTARFAADHVITYPKDARLQQR